MWKKVYGDEFVRTGQIKYRFKIGDIVKIRKERSIFSRGFTQQFSEENFKIRKRLYKKRPEYEIIDGNGEIIVGRFYEDELVRASEKWLRRRIRS